MSDIEYDPMNTDSENIILQVEYRLIGQPDVLLWQIDRYGHKVEADVGALYEEGIQLVPNWENIMRELATREMARAADEYNKALAVYRARCAIRAWATGDVRGEH